MEYPRGSYLIVQRLGRQCFRYSSIVVSVFSHRTMRVSHPVRSQYCVSTISMDLAETGPFGTSFREPQFFSLYRQFLLTIPTSPPLVPTSPSLCTDMSSPATGTLANRNSTSDPGSPANRNLRNPNPIGSLTSTPPPPPPIRTITNRALETNIHGWRQRASAAFSAAFWMSTSETPAWSARYSTACSADAWKPISTPDSQPGGCKSPERGLERVRNPIFVYSFRWSRI